MLFRKRERADKGVKRILIVEDEPLVAFDNEHFLRDAGFEIVATVDTVAEAEKAIRTEEIDLILADVRLSNGGDGLDVARAAKHKGIAVLFVTGACPEDAQPLAVGCLAKPYSPRDLLAAIKAVDAVLTGKPVKRIPRGLNLFGIEEDAG